MLNFGYIDAPFPAFPKSEYGTSDQISNGHHRSSFWPKRLKCFATCTKSTCVHDCVMSWTCIDLTWQLDIALSAGVQIGAHLEGVGADVAQGDRA